MSYIEWALAQAAALQRSWEEALRKRLAAARGGSIGAQAAGEERTETANAAQEAAETTAKRAVIAAEETENGGGTAAMAQGWAAQAIIPRAAERGESPARPAANGDAAEWIRTRLGQSGAAGAYAAAAQERSEARRYAGAPEEDAEGTAETLGRALERDARRYDSGFLYY